MTTDEGPRADTSLEKMAGLKTLREGGRITAAVSSQISDAASAVLVASEDAVARFGLTPAGPRPPHLARAATTPSTCSPRRSAPPGTRSRRPG